MEFDLENPFVSLEEDEEEEEEHCSHDSFSDLFAAEAYHMSSHSAAAAARGIDLSVRGDAVSVILQAQFSCNLDPLMCYLAVNYVDRFLSRKEIPTDKPWIAKLLAISCLSLAFKMKKSHFSVADFQREEGFIFDAQTIKRMELLVLGTLEWRMRSITPFSFLRYFISLFSPLQPPLLHALKSRASHTLLKAQNHIKVLEFKPSVVAAAALLSAAYELFPMQFPSFRSAVSSCEYVNKERLWECCLAMSHVVADGWDSTLETFSSSDTPVTVLAHHCPSSESERTVGSSSDRRDLKKRRLATSPLPHLHRNN